MRFAALSLCVIAMLVVVPGLHAGDGENVNLTATQKKVIDIGLNDNNVVGVVDHLVNGIGPRLTGSHQDHLACEWARDLFVSFGLQNVVMEEAGEFPVAFQRGPWRGQMIAPEKMDLEFGTPAWSAGTQGVEEGPALMLPADMESIDAEKMKGAWVMMPSQRGRRDREARQAQREVRESLEEYGIAGWIYPT
ncbi:MAG: hypothetical protein VYD70_01640, partial [Planctomycetota bacterium]|nr:hypothetical protein [Planctomycetota bacterium]